MEEGSPLVSGSDTAGGYNPSSRFVVFLEGIANPQDWDKRVVEARSLLIRFLVRRAMATWKESQLKKVA